jgi:hypothetical protein
MNSHIGLIRAVMKVHCIAVIVCVFGIFLWNNTSMTDITMFYTNLCHLLLQNL